MRAICIGLLATVLLATQALGCGKKETTSTPDKAPAVSPTKVAEPAGPTKWDNDDELVWPMDTKQVAASAVPAGDGEARDFATSGGKAMQHVWKRMAQYEGSYLRTWASALSQEPASPMEVVDAFNELAFAVTGPKGFWRDTLPNKWLGCQTNGDTEPCQRLATQASELARWDEIQAQMTKLPEKKARRFLGRNEARLMAYFDNYVPLQPSASAMKETGFYKAHLDGVMD
ncbi:MAG: hypothetical protein ACI9WU_002850 [Myxococcota bacterium]|jgi:hypothetical protein